MTTATCDWGLAGARALGAGSAVMIVVDVLSFSTSVDVAVARGAEVYPLAFADPAAIMAYALGLGAVAAGRRGDPAFRVSLSPVSLADIPAGTKLVLPSPNGSAISAAVSGVPVFAGCLRNARAVAAGALDIANGGPITVIAAGEHWPDGSFRPAIEDLFGVGAILSHLGDRQFTPEAIVARDSYRAAAPRLAALIRDSISGRELIDRGYPGDVAAALAENISTAAPILREGRFIACR
jgi:2-phosphosulfolactate phosphatase